MKKLFTLLTMLVVGIGSMWAQITVGPSTGTYMDALDGSEDNNGWAVYWKSSAKATDGTTSLLILQAPSGMNTSNGNIYANENAYTLTAPDGYIISGYTFNGTATDGDLTFTPAGGSGTTITSGNSLGEALPVTVRAQSTTFTLSGSGRIESLNLVVTVSPIPVTIANSDSGNLPDVYGSFSGQIYTTNAASGLADITITASSGLTITKATVNVTGYGKCFQLSTSAAATDYTVTLQAPTGYVITGYYLGCSANTKDAVHTLTAEDGTSVVASAPPYNSTYNTPEPFEVTGLNVNSTYFTISTANKANALYLPVFRITVAKASEVVNVTYNVMFNGSQVATTTVNGLIAGTAPALPASLQKSMCTYSYYSDEACTTPLSALTSSTEIVYAKCTFAPPFTVSSDFANAKWYLLKMNNAFYPTYVSGGTPNVTLPSNNSIIDDNVMWAFIGDPYNGFQIINKGAGDGYELSSADDNKGTTGSESYAIMTNESQTYNRWFPKSSTSYTNGFFLYNSANHALNHRSNDNLAYWTEGADAGSTFNVEEASNLINYWNITSSDYKLNRWSAMGESTPSGVNALSSSEGLQGTFTPYSRSYSVTNEEPNTYFIRFQWTSGSHRLQTLGVDVLDADDNIIDSDYHFGYTGTSNSNRDYYVTVPAGTYKLRYIITGDSDKLSDSKGTITVTSSPLPFVDSTSESPIYYAMSIADNSSWFQNSDGTHVNNTNNRSLPTGDAKDYAWVLIKDESNLDYKLYNVGADKYLGGKTVAGELTLGDEASANLFRARYNDASSIKFYDKTNNLWIDRSDGHPYAYSSGQKITFLRMKKVTFSTAVAVDDGEPVSAIYLACNGSNSFTLPDTYHYRIGETTYTAGDAVNAIKDGTENISVKVLKTVTFSIAVAVDGGDAVSTIYVACDGSDSFTLPAGYTYTFGGATYVTTTSAAAAIAAAGTDDISVTVSPVVTDLSDLSNDKNYKIICNRGSLSTYTDEGTTYLASTVKTDLGISSKEFAILNYLGRNYLYSIDDEKFVTFSGGADTERAQLQTNVTGTVDAIAFEEVSSAVYAIKFNNDKEKYLNSTVDYTYGIIINGWGDSPSEYDDGNQYVIVEVDDFDSETVYATLKDFIDGEITRYNGIIADLEAVNWGLDSEGNKGKLNYYNFIGEYAGYAGNESYIISGLKTAGYTSENLNTVQGMNINLPINGGYALNMPATGKFYRIKGYSGNYITSNTKTNNALMNGTASADNIIYYSTEGNLIFYNSGYGLYNTCIVAPLNQTLNTYTFKEGAQSSHYYIISDATGIGTYCVDNVSNFNRQTSAATSGNYQTDWTMEEVTELPLSIAANSYTTFSAPVAVTIPGNCNAYIATIKDGSVVKVKEVTGNVAKETGLIIGNSDGSTKNLTFNIVANGTNYSDEVGDKNYLVANVAASMVDKANNYFFGTYNDNYVFAKIAGEGTRELAGHKAYLDGSSVPSASGARLAIIWGDDDPTGIAELNDENIVLSDGKYYQNGKVVVVRNGVKYNVAGQIIK